jgi:hypothetical protein
MLDQIEEAMDSEQNNILIAQNNATDALKGTTA